MDDERREEALEQSGAGDYGGAPGGGDAPETSPDSATGGGSPTGETAEAPPGGAEHEPRSGALSEGDRDLPGGDFDTLTGDGSEG